MCLCATPLQQLRAVRPLGPDRTFTGKYRHYLKHADSGYLIALQRADLVNREGPYDYVLQWWL